MKVKLRTILASTFTFLLLTACTDDPSHFYGADKEMKILDEDGDATTNARVSMIGATTLTIVGGVGDFHVVEVEDEEILSADYSSKYTSYDGPIKIKTIPAEIRIKANKYGSTVVSITDTDIDKTIHIHVEVVDHYVAMTVLESAAEGITKDMYLAFKHSDENEYRFVSKEGKEYGTFESGEYHFWLEDYVPEDALFLTLKHEDTETLWKITDADNNKDGHKYYISDIYTGMRFPSAIATKLSYTWYYPKEFLFTDTSNPARNFKTTAIDTEIKYTF